MTSQIGKQKVITNILPDISRSKGNYAMKFVQLIEYHMKNIFYENSRAKYDRETNSRPFF